MYKIINYIIHCEICKMKKKNNHQVQVPENKTNPKKMQQKFTNSVTASINTEYTDS